MNLFDFHTHIPPQRSGTEFMLNVSIGQVPSGISACSVGLHPWDVMPSWREPFEQLRTDAVLPNVWAIGECGLDALRGGEMPLQIEAFRAQVRLADMVGKPVLVHCVRAFEVLLRLHKEWRPQQPWIVHGFRGKPALAQQIMAKGMLLSFGHVFQAETLKMVATSEIPFYLETDCAEVSIREVYRLAESVLGGQSLFPRGSADGLPFSGPLAEHVLVGRPTCQCGD